jgi:phage-related protein
MRELMGQVKELRGALESFGASVDSRAEDTRGQLESLVSGVVDAIASLRPEVESAVSELSSQLDAFDAELAELEP